MYFLYLQQLSRDMLETYVSWAVSPAEQVIHLLQGQGVGPAFRPLAMMVPANVTLFAACKMSAKPPQPRLEPRGGIILKLQCCIDDERDKSESCCGHCRRSLP